MRLHPLAILAFACLAHLNCRADVIYEWSALDHEVPRNINLRLVFKDDVVVSGSTSFHVPYGDYSPSHPESGLVSLLYQVPGVPTMSYMPAVERFHYGLGILDIRVDFTDDGFLTGWIRANDSNSNFEMISTGNIMKITDARSDQGMDEAGCGNDLSLCNGATGVIRRVATVPEPVTPGLLGAGLLALLAARKKKPGKPRV